MGTSTDAIIVFGIPLEDESIPWFDEDEYGHRPAPTPEDDLFPSWLVFWGESHDGIKVVTHCSDDCPRHLVTVEGTEVRAWRGQTKRIVPRDMVDPGPERIAALEAFCQRYGLAPSGSAGWYLVSYWA